MNLLAVAETAETAGEVGKPFVTPAAGKLFNYAPLVCWSHDAEGVCTFGLTWPMVVMFIMSALLTLFFLKAFAKPKIVPTGAQNLAEAMTDFVRNQIAEPTLGNKAAAWVPYLTVTFFWVLVLNVTGIIPPILFPITSRMAIPAMLAALAWIIYNAIGMKNQGAIGYFKNMMFPPGVPKPIYILLAPIELISTVIVRPLTLAVRLFANMVAGHMILAVLFVGTAVWFASPLGKVTFVLPFAFGTIMTGFEIFVAGMQAFIITILTAVYIAGAQEAHH